MITSYLVTNWIRITCNPYRDLKTFESRITNFKGGAYGFLEKNEYKNVFPKVSAGRFFVIPGTMENTFL